VQNNNVFTEIGEDETGVSDADYTRVRSLIHHMSRADIPDLAGLLVLRLIYLCHSQFVSEHQPPGPNAIAWLRWLIVRALKCRLDTEPLIDRISKMFDTQFISRLFNKYVSTIIIN
jgi:hypothetical protein